MNAQIDRQQLCLNYFKNDVKRSIFYSEGIWVCLDAFHNTEMLTYRWELPCTEYTIYSEQWGVGI